MANPKVCLWCSREYTADLTPMKLSCKCIFCSSCVTFFKDNKFETCPFEEHDFNPKKTEVERNSLQKIKSSNQFESNAKKAEEIKSDLRNQLKICEEMIQEREASLKNLEVLAVSYNLIKNYNSEQFSTPENQLDKKVEVVKKCQMLELEKATPSILNNIVKNFSTDFSESVFNYLLQTEKLKHAGEEGIVWLGNRLTCVPMQDSATVKVKNVSSSPLRVAGIGVNLGNGEANEGRIKGLKIRIMKKVQFECTFALFSDKFLHEVPVNGVTFSKNTEYIFEFFYDSQGEQNKFIMTKFEDFLEIGEVSLKIRAEEDKPSYSSLAYIKFIEVN